MSTVSSWFFDSDASFGGGGDDENDAIFPRGYDDILNVFRPGLDIRLNKAVTHVTESGSAQGCSGTNSMAVTTADGAVICCRAAIVTVPLGVLKAGSITFNPALPATKVSTLR
jgi:polyamine oxidase